MSKAPRFAFLDVLRGFSVLWMIQVHLTNVLLDPALRTTWYFDLLNIANGFVAPAFIFCAGSGLWIALDRKGAAYLRRGPELWLYLRRLGYILFWAYMLHVPFFSLERLLMASRSELLPGLQVDVLQTIVYASLAALIIFYIIRDLKKSTLTFGAISVLIMTGTAFVWKSDAFLWFPDVIAVMISPPPASPFPLLPWMCYLFAGAFFTGIFMQSPRKTHLARQMIWLSVVVVGIVFLFKNLPFESPWSDTWWSTSPGLHIFRISGVVLAMSVLYLFEQRLRESRFGIEMQIIGNESLFLYLSHLLIVYGQGTIVFKALTGISSTGYMGIAIAWVVVTLPLLVIMKWWHVFKQRKPELAHRFFMIQIAWMIITLLLTPSDFNFTDLLGITPQ